MAEKSVLTKDELAYINKLVGHSRSIAKRQPGFRIDGGAKANAMLMQLGARANLSLEAELANYSLSFPLQLNEDEFHNISLELAPPTIYERGPTPRAWRLHLDQPLPLLKDDGADSALIVHELSPHGLLVDAGRSRKAPKHFHLRLALPGEGALQINARHVRETQGGMAAYEVEFPKHRDAERMRHFLFKQHRKLHPELEEANDETA